MCKRFRGKHVFLSQNGDLNHLENFITSLSGRLLINTWLQDDFEDISVVKRVPMFYLLKMIMKSLIQKGNIKDKFFSLNCKQAELDFERQESLSSTMSNFFFNNISSKTPCKKRSGLRDDLAEINTKEMICKNI